MEGMFDRLTGQPEIPQATPSPIVLPNIRYQFSKQRDPGTGEVVAYLLQIWLESLPLMQLVIPFDRLSFAHFIKSAEGATDDPERNGDG